MAPWPACPIPNRSRRLALLFASLLAGASLAACSGDEGHGATPASQLPAASSTPATTALAGSDPTTTLEAAPETTREAVPSTASSTAESTTTTATPVPDAVVIPYESGLLEVTDEGVWVFPHLDPVALRIDPSTMTVDVEIDLTSYVTDSVYGDGMLWVRTELDESSYTRLDPATGDTLARVPNVAGGQPIIAFGSVWAAGLGGEVFRIDPDTNEVEEIQVQSAGAFLLTATTDTLWTLGFADGLVGMVPSTGTLTEPWRPLTLLGEPPSSMASAGATTLLFGTTGRLTEIDPVGRVIVTAIDAPAGTSPLHAVDLTDLVGLPPTWVFGDPATTDPQRGTELPKVVVVTVDLAGARLTDQVEVLVPESAVRDGDTLWTTPLRQHIVTRSAMR